MREYLFRGKRTDNGNWAEGSFGIKRNGDRKIYCIMCETVDIRGDGTYFTDYEVIPESVGQFVGLIDEYGERKWEGDIFEFDTIRYVIEYDETELVWLARCYYDDDLTISLCEFLAEEIEVIGNIHDNPDLPHKRPE